MSFKDKVVIVTGASSGIGASIAIKFAEEGAKLVIVGRNEENLNKVSEICERNNNKPLIIVADVVKDDEVKRIVYNTISHYGQLDILVNNAGRGGPVGITTDHAVPVFDTIMATNLRSAFYLTNLAAPHLVKTKGNIINISSIVALGVLTRTGFAYATSKAGMDQFTKCAALELAPMGVRVNSINPGPVKTNFFENLGAPAERLELINASMKKGTALQQVSEPEEIADMVLFLASDKAKGITGSINVIDNGALLKGNFGI